MRLQRFDSIQNFWERVKDYLYQYEAEHNLLLGILQTLLHHPERYPEFPYLAIVQTDDNIAAIAIRTPPNKLLLSKAQNLQALELIVQDLLQEPLPGVSGLVTEVEAFVPLWQTLTGQGAQPGLASRIYQLTQVEPVAIAKGALRLATEPDRPLLCQWFAAFYAEIDLGVNEEIERLVDIRLQQQSLHLWDDRTSVSMVGGNRFSSTAARIAPVYTPPQHRRQGYATAVVAALSQSFLDHGCDRCFLFTDLANPTSNSIYQQIGYRPICDWREYAFTQ